MDYRMKLAKRMLFNKKGSLIGAILAVSIGILVIHVNFVIFQGLYDAIIRDLSDLRNGDLLITDKEDLIDESDRMLIAWLERIPYVEAAAPRLSSTASINTTKSGMLHEETRIPVTGVDPILDIRTSAVHETVASGQFVFSENSIVLGRNVASDLGDVQVGDNIRVRVTDRFGDDEFRRFIVSGITSSPGGQGFDFGVLVHIDALRDMLKRHDETESIMVRLNDDEKAVVVKDMFLQAFSHDDFVAETIEESAEEQLAGFRSGIALINLIGYFGMMSSAFAIVTIQMMLVSGKTREIGVMRALGARRKDIMLLFLFQGMLIGAIGAGAGTAAGLAYTFYAKETKLTFNDSIALEVSYDAEKIVQTAITSFGLTVIAALYPSYRATKLMPVEAMRTV